ncbi:hypothetical protein SAMN06296036_101484 [Pseudobacteriovorax antillogorgiicola]|uniref:Uncharacterized protein n=1 Tax=Pseudobacteriovorax antillogorgiicola TaxID=1513793 RepID=A0A1Y6B4P8_9BACT|nr:hypothetical protein EDD56_1012 [Pseudobacteriovorax antillogorgiicola]SME91801.1 hypothetical protein SAMN06296036_101484 [Pseudobacteriovorax antillogorgiicola]
MQPCALDLGIYEIRSRILSEVTFISAGKTAITNRSKGKSRQNSECDKLGQNVAQRDEIIANLTVANTVLKKIRTYKAHCHKP